MTDSNAPRRQKVQAAEVGTDILTALAELAPATSLSRLAEHVGMPASKVHRYLQALIASGFAEQDPQTNHYGLGRAALFVGLAALGRLDVVKLATPHLTHLRDELNETCFLAVWGNRGPTVVHVEQAIRAVTLVTQVGSVLPLLGSSTGLVFNAFMPNAETAALREDELKLPTAPSAAALATTMSELQRTHIQPVHGLLMAGVNALSAPLFSGNQRLAGVITLVGTAPGFTAEVESEAAQRLLTAAQAISTRMGAQMAP
ncbi:transcriptional regulator, IclR family [Pseudomonas cuatrocienegasensis]|uniref:Transcriptional regulator, IclR family n=1 Tax=Pseudomonas cuatrocienegasensis TaxID=543360 RepID=A0ABY1BR95_9PSED|nr:MULTISPECIES: IclR family transcriptional regulator [Pseudomonas]OEC32826.1 IclR family transcriptional regulator [Pseudomonas sp. 21C1]SER44214.1 transcriptional regulator, IclR family [Pseudomonas cuatrocienegasensis]